MVLPPYYVFGSALVARIAVVPLVGFRIVSVEGMGVAGYRNRDNGSKYSAAMSKAFVAAERGLRTDILHGSRGMSLHDGVFQSRNIPLLGVSVL